MRYFIIAMFFLPLLSSCAEAQADIPPAVSKAFDVKFPGAVDLRWDKEDAKTYEAEFTMDGSEMSALFDASGTWMETETSIKTRDLPQAVHETIAKQFSGYDIEDAEQIEDAKGSISYEVELENEEHSVEVVFTADGHVLKQKAEKEDGQNERDND
ncbi:PepSY-like domain-containing protein [bacterium]|nr:PepSY-like domain-containing protein [bacterium]